MDASNIFLFGLAVLASLTVITGVIDYATDPKKNDDFIVFYGLYGMLFLILAFVSCIIGIQNEDNTRERDFEREVQECVAMGGTPELDGYELDECVGV